jgi:hypothetical protein
MAVAVAGDAEARRAGAPTTGAAGADEATGADEAAGADDVAVAGDGVAAAEAALAGDVLPGATVVVASPRAAAGRAVCDPVDANLAGVVVTSSICVGPNEQAEQTRTETNRSERMAVPIAQRAPAVV